MKKVVLIAVVCAAVAVSACRRESHDESFKLGGPAPTVEVAR